MDIVELWLNKSVCTLLQVQPQYDPYELQKFGVSIMRYINIGSWFLRSGVTICSYDNIAAKDPSELNGLDSCLNIIHLVINAQAVDQCSRFFLQTPPVLVCRFPYTTRYLIIIPTACVRFHGHVRSVQTMFGFAIFSH